MAALAVVDAAARSEDPPRGPGDLSRYLLDRERRYWARLHGEAGTTTAARMVFIAALAGPQLPNDGHALLARTGLDTAAGTSAQHLLDLHARCYPPDTDETVLEPLYPDRLAEDFIALTLPGARPASHVDTWAANLVTTRYVDDDHVTRHRPGPLFTRDQHQRPPAYTGRALTFLAAAAGRHPHTADRLRALLAVDPALAIDSGGNALLAVTPHTDEPLARAILRRLPARSVELDHAAAELTAHLTTLTTVTDPTDHAWLQAVLALRLANAGRREEALGPAEDATDIYRRLAEANPAAHLPDPATSLWAYAWVCVKTNSSSPQALDAVTEAIGLYQQLAERLPQVFGERLWSAYHTRADVLDGLGRTNEAAELRSQLAAVSGADPKTR